MSPADRGRGLQFFFLGNAGFLSLCETSGERAVVTNTGSQTETTAWNSKTPWSEVPQGGQRRVQGVRAKPWAPWGRPSSVKTQGHSFKLDKNENQSDPQTPSGLPFTPEPPAPRKSSTVRDFPWGSPHLLAPTYRRHLSPASQTAQPLSKSSSFGGTEEKHARRPTQALQIPVAGYALVGS